MRCSLGRTVRPWPCLESTDDTTALLLLWCSSCPCLVLVWCSSCTTHGSLSHPIASPSHPMGWVMQQASSQWHNRTHGEKRTEVQTTRLVGGQSIKSGWMKRGGTWNTVLVTFVSRRAGAVIGQAPTISVLPSRTCALGGFPSQVMVLYYLHHPSPSSVSQRLSS